MRVLFVGVNAIFLSSLLFLCGCTMYIFDPQYYKARSYAKKHSATYVLQRDLYDEIMQHKKEAKKSTQDDVALQKKILKEIQQGTNATWIEKREYYVNLAHQKSGYYHEQNAQTLFILDMMQQSHAATQILSNGRPYYTGLHAHEVEIPESVRAQIGGETYKNMKFRQIMYPQYYYIDETGKAQLISVGVVYYYSNVNKVYGLKEDSNIDVVFANGEWLYLRKDKVKYIEGK